MKRMKPADTPVRLGACEKCGVRPRYGDKKWCLVCIEKWRSENEKSVV